MLLGSQFTFQEQCLSKKSELLLLCCNLCFQVRKLLAQIPLFQQNGRWRALPCSITDPVRVRWLLTCSFWRGLHQSFCETSITRFEDATMQDRELLHLLSC